MLSCSVDFEKKDTLDRFREERQDVRDRKTHDTVLQDRQGTMKRERCLAA